MVFDHELVIYDAFRHPCLQFQGFCARISTGLLHNLIIYISLS